MKCSINFHYIYGMFHQFLLCLFKMLYQFLIYLWNVPLTSIMFMKYFINFHYIYEVFHKFPLYLWNVPLTSIMFMKCFINFNYIQGVPKKHGNSVTNSISSLLWISIVIPNFNSHNNIMSARVYFMKRVKDCKDVSIMSLQDEQWIRTSFLCLYTAIFLFY